MASNPMQRKARNSFLLGVLVTTLILGCVIGFLIYQMYAAQKEQEEIEATRKMVYVLKQDLVAGATILEANNEGKFVDNYLTIVEVDANLAPSTAITVQNYSQEITKEKVTKIDLKAGTVLTTDMIVNSEDATATDTREQEYNMIILPTYLEKDDYVDIRLRLPSGEDYIVVSKKKVLDTNEETVWMNLSEMEILTMSNAIVEAYQIVGSELYATTYVEPGIQESASVTYVPSVSVMTLINENPNIVQTAKQELAQRYSSMSTGRTNVINPAINAGAEDAQNNVSTGVSSSIEIQKQQRKEYLQELESTTTTTN